MRAPKGFSVLAVAYRDIEERAAYSAADERDLTLARFLRLRIRPSLTPEVGELRRDGV